MADPPPTSSLPIPEASIDALLKVEPPWRGYDELLDAIVNIAAPVVAAELRRLADWHWGDELAVSSISDALQARADELEGGAA